ncbi:MAG TPA: excisionase [Firmicutes bacterium]|jgi:putative molybdopterin biosynthesis protein|nr:excisionase [Bacillota bacterium]
MKGLISIMPNEKVYTPEEVANILKISRFTVYQMIKRGDMPSCQVGRRIRIEASDLERYIQSVKNDTPALIQNSSPIVRNTADIASWSTIGSKDGLIICGQDVVLDVLTKHLERQLPQLRFLRQYLGSIPALFGLYQGTANLATAHLWDGDTGEYNISYVRKILPGQRLLIYNLVYRMEGFYVANGNPKSIQAWTDLAKPGIRIINRECGAGARVLLDEQLRKLNIASDRIIGYDNEEPSHLSVASCVARGEADVGIGIEKAALQVPKIDFIPLQKERYDLIFRKSDLNLLQFQQLLLILNSASFKNEISGMGGYDVSQMGQLMGEI